MEQLFVFVEQPIFVVVQQKLLVLVVEQPKLQFKLQLFKFQQPEL